MDALMTGAESLLQSALKSGVDTCFANPGTTEMDLVAALDKTPDVKTVLALFEGVCTGMADGYGRMLDRPAMTLLHLGVGLGNGIANLHNARRAQTPIVNIIGDHPVAHVPYDAPLTSDIATMAIPVSNEIFTSTSSEMVGGDFARLVAKAKTLPGKIATHITPSDVMRGETPMVHDPVAPDAPPAIDDALVNECRDVLEGNGAETAIIINGRALRQEGLTLANQVAAKTGCTLFSVCFPGRLERGAGVAPITRLPYFPEMVLDKLQPFKTLILIGGYTDPVSFFKYEGIPSSLVPEGCSTIRLADPAQDTVMALQALCEAVNASGESVKMQELKTYDKPTGSIDRNTISPAIAATLPENVVISDESGMSGGPIFYHTMTGPAHTSMYLTGGGIGYGMPCATGAAVACPDRPVLSLQADGSGMYTVQALWTQAREQLNVTTVLFSNKKYQILQVELERAGIKQPGPIATSLTELSNPDIGWASIARGFGVPAAEPTTAEEFVRELEKAYAEPGPHMIVLNI
jgi:acetolactate synthase-1/2/3 large subunit